MSSAAVAEQAVATATVNTDRGPVAATATQQVAVATTAAQQGMAGPPGNGLEHVQAYPAANWIIPHTMGRRPGVTVYDATGAETITDVFATDMSVTVTWAQPTAGSAVLT